MANVEVEAKMKRNSLTKMPSLAQPGVTDSASPGFSTESRLGSSKLCKIFDRENNIETRSLMSIDN